MTEQRRGKNVAVFGFVAQLVFMGLLVGLVALSMFTPLFDLTSMPHGGM